MTPLVLSASDPKVAAVLLDIATLKRWEVLRRSTTPLTAAELAAACGANHKSVQASIDLLVEAGFAVPVRATRSSPRAGFRSASTKVIIRLDHETEATMKASQEFLLVYREAREQHRRQLLDQVKSRADLPIRLRSVEATLTPTLTREESLEALEILSSAARALYAIENRARERGAALAPGDGLTSYCIFLQMRPLEHQELPMPQYEVWASDKLDKHIGKVAKAPDAALSPADREIARRLAAGDKRPKIAADLGLNPHTLASATKRIYARLGVRSRAELAVRMRGA